MNSGTLERVRPAAQTTIRTRGCSYTVACFEGTTWSLAPLQVAGDQHKAQDLAYRVGAAMEYLGAKDAYAPNPTKFNGRIVTRDMLTEQILLSRGVTLHRNRDVPADGVPISDPGSAVVFSAGGCSMIVATMGNEMVVAHAGRDCVIDRKRIVTKNREEGRHHESVVDSIVSSLSSSDYFRKRIQVGVFYSIKPQDFLHKIKDEDPEHLKYNIPAAEILPEEYGDACGWVEKNRGIYINVPTIIKAQFMRLGVPEENISLEHAFLGDELPHTRNGDNKRRYLAAVVRHT